MNPRLLSPLIFLALAATQVVVLGGAWAAFAGRDFLFWSFDESSTEAGVMILAFLEPAAVALAGIAFAGVGAAGSALASSDRRRAFSTILVLVVVAAGAGAGGWALGSSDNGGSDVRTENDVEPERASEAEPTVAVVPPSSAGTEEDFVRECLGNADGSAFIRVFRPSGEAWDGPLAAYVSEYGRFFNASCVDVAEALVIGECPLADGTLWLRSLEPGGELPVRVAAAWALDNC